MGTKPSSYLENEFEPLHSTEEYVNWTEEHIYCTLADVKKLMNTPD
jgi:hypothetical protein